MGDSENEFTIDRDFVIRVHQARAAMRESGQKPPDRILVGLDYAQFSGTILLGMIIQQNMLLKPDEVHLVNTHDYIKLGTEIVPTGVRFKMKGN